MKNLILAIVIAIAATLFSLPTSAGWKIESNTLVATVDLSTTLSTASSESTLVMIDMNMAHDGNLLADGLMLYCHVVGATGGTGLTVKVYPAWSMTDSLGSAALCVALAADTATTDWTITGGPPQREFGAVCWGTPGLETTDPEFPLTPAVGVTLSADRTAGTLYIRAMKLDRR